MPLEEVRDSWLNQQASHRTSRKHYWQQLSDLYLKTFFFLVSTCCIGFVVVHDIFLTWIFHRSLACSKVSVVSPLLHPARFRVHALQGAPAPARLCRFAGEICPHSCSAATFHPSDLAASSCALSLARVRSDPCSVVWHSAGIKIQLTPSCKTAVSFRCFLPLSGSFLELLGQGQSVHACVGGRKSWKALVSLKDPTKQQGCVRHTATRGQICSAGSAGEAELREGEITRGWNDGSWQTRTGAGSCEADCNDFYSRRTMAISVDGWNPAGYGVKVP